MKKPGTTAIFSRTNTKPTPRRPRSTPDWNGKLAPGPLKIGCDEFFLLPTTNDRVPQVYVENHNVLNPDPADPISPDAPTGISQRSGLKMDWSHGHNGISSKNPGKLKERIKRLDADRRPG